MNQVHFRIKEARVFFLFLFSRDAHVLVFINVRYIHYFDLGMKQIDRRTHVHTVGGTCSFAYFLAFVSFGGRGGIGRTCNVWQALQKL